VGKKTVAELLVETLVSREVSRIYGVAGDSLNGITDSIRRQDQLRWVHMRHEETAAFADVLAVEFWADPPASVGKALAQQLARCRAPDIQ
jgi:hypothetical protein